MRTVNDKQVLHIHLQFIFLLNTQPNPRCQVPNAPPYSNYYDNMQVDARKNNWWFLLVDNEKEIDETMNTTISKKY